MNSGSAGKSGKAFTRLELLAVACGLSLIVLVTLPLLAVDASQARQALCLDNLRLLTRAHLMYALENEWYAPNEDGSGYGLKNIWAEHTAGQGNKTEFNSDPLIDKDALLSSYLEYSAEPFRCPEDSRRGVYSGDNPLLRSNRVVVPAARSFSMNHAVGTQPLRSVPTPSDGRWLDNRFSHTTGSRWHTYGRPEQVIAPSPAKLFMLIDEEVRTIDGPAFSFGMAVEEWLDRPATRHGFGASIAFADGHVEVKGWEDPRTGILPINVPQSAPGSPDYQWLRERTSALIVR